MTTETKFNIGDVIAFSSKILSITDIVADWPYGSEGVGYVAVDANGTEGIRPLTDADDIELGSTVVINCAIITILDNRPDWLYPELVGRAVAWIENAPRPYIVRFENAPDGELLAFAESELVVVPDIDRVVRYETATAIRRRGRTRLYDRISTTSQILRGSILIPGLIRDWRSYEVAYYFKHKHWTFDAVCEVSVCEPWHSDFDRYAWENMLDDEPAPNSELN